MRVVTPFTFGNRAQRWVGVVLWFAGTDRAELMMRIALISF